MGKNTYINNPKSGTPVFGHVNEIKFGNRHKIIFLEGPIYLRQGVHTGPNKGFGVKHIVAEHMNDLRRGGYVDSEAEDASEEAVAEFVSDIISPGARLFSECAVSAGGIKIMVLTRATGMAVIQEKTDGEGATIYSVVTAYFGNPKGSMIGTLG